MTDNERRMVVNQVRALSVSVGILILLVGANFYLAFTNPGQEIQTVAGPIGPQGEVGRTGEKGEPGVSVVGPQGPQGEKGNTGDSGATGSQGATGPAGQRGETGATGATGANGKTPEMACINGFVAWRHTGETSWRTLYPAVCTPSQSLNE